MWEKQHTITELEFKKRPASIEALRQAEAQDEKRLRTLYNSDPSDLAPTTQKWKVAPWTGKFADLPTDPFLHVNYYEGNGEFFNLYCEKQDGTYTHASMKTERIEPEQVYNLLTLGHMQTIELQSGDSTDFEQQVNFGRVLEPVSVNYTAFRVAASLCDARCPPGSSSPKWHPDDVTPEHVLDAMYEGHFTYVNVDNFVIVDSKDKIPPDALVVNHNDVENAAWRTLVALT